MASTGCRLRTVAAYKLGTGKETANPNWVCCPATVVDGQRVNPHEDGYGHIAGGVETSDGDVLEWSDGTITHQGKAVNKDGSPVSATLATDSTWSLPDQPDVHTIVKAGPKNYVRWTEEDVSSPWREVDNSDNMYSWPQLFVKSFGKPVTYVGVDAKERVKTEIRNILNVNGISFPTSTARNLVRDLDNKGLVSNEALVSLAKVGDTYRIGTDKFPDNITAIQRVRDDGTSSGMREWTKDESNGLFRLEPYDAGFADPTNNTSTRYRDGGKMKTHGTPYKVTKVKG